MVAMPLTMLPVLWFAIGRKYRSARSAMRLFSRNPPELRKSGCKMSIAALITNGRASARRIQFSPVQMGTGDISANRFQLSEYATGSGSSKKRGLTSCNATAMSIELRRSNSQWQPIRMSCSKPSASRQFSNPWRSRRSSSLESMRFDGSRPGSMPGLFRRGPNLCMLIPNGLSLTCCAQSRRTALSKKSSGFEWS